ncbi:hypothetical protein Desmer_3311 [Desulfosporosinus meridiei DSM 13257]|uniref:Uncharacterized protein n=1 Tax=Desulfosporosinus meridiei (strain ATCC BAA-275 / DSM 13257 / KCTC 12902 / NCIMB 13706 / S10) TaxID=768704 RepID=J7ITY6_DESMD|nr:hypothetical protein Desmer_3311 [Desulfosporosinus meridiei DSM 13257]
MRKEVQYPFFKLINHYIMGQEGIVNAMKINLNSYGLLSCHVF